MDTQGHRGVEVPVDAFAIVYKELNSLIKEFDSSVDISALLCFRSNVQKLAFLSKGIKDLFQSLVIRNIQKFDPIIVELNDFLGRLDKLIADQFTTTAQVVQMLHSLPSASQTKYAVILKFSISTPILSFELHLFRIITRLYEAVAKKETEAIEATVAELMGLFDSPTLTAIESMEELQKRVKAVKMHVGDLPLRFDVGLMADINKYAELVIALFENE